MTLEEKWETVFYDVFRMDYSDGKTDYLVVDTTSIPKPNLAEIQKQIEESEHKKTGKKVTSSHLGRKRVMKLFQSRKF